MSCGDKNKPNDSAHVSLFPSPPWQLVTKHHSPSSEPPIRPPTPPGTNVYRMFGNLYNLDDAILRSLESQGVRRVYPQQTKLPSVLFLKSESPKPNGRTKIENGTSSAFPALYSVWDRKLRYDWDEMAQWLEREFTNRKVHGSNPTSASRLPLSRLGKPGSIPALVLSSGGMTGTERMLQPSDFLKV
ncbi:Mediator of RNA polymerase II transcription subunit 7 [Clonorchis sinensis]|uniref:Mediator of RNA polymerase II transcription subunit 7 n=1 Tax=Clonorchis sinensis TaxID=79923 RepID=A0A419PU44_CLOSI|nr:Mediator of RNA polymerase II transcription subunit 7 [Clonorchis sinensis]